MLIGEFAPSVFFKTCSYVIIATLFIIYYLSQLLGHEKPFPNCWISDCAGHYPEFVFFRVATISGSVLVMLGWMTNHFYLKSISREASFRVEAYRPEIAMVAGLIGAMLLMGSTANLDTGKRHPKWHTFCASRFFMFTVGAQIYNTVVYWLVRSKIGKVSKPNNYFKAVLLALLVLQLLVSIRYGVDEVETAQAEVASVIGKILEWTLTITVILGFYSMSLDVAHFKFVYEMNKPAVHNELEEVD